MPMISEPESELSTSNSNRYESHSEVSDRHLHEPVQAVLHSVQGQGLGDFATNTPRSYELLAYPQNFPQAGGNNQGVQCQKEGDNQGRSPSSFYQQALSKPTSPRSGKNKKKNWIKPYPPSYRIPKIQKDAMDNVFNMARPLMDFKDKEEQEMRQPHFPKKKPCLQML
ncbi:hypothetical protein O181_055535 [Austropuccinia psidii MF-1]|uniref:Uncharacterized protein n=1 Tax=Austropuccinia psidii MF-1 TaxID=1389203 RepID=A0A9Q3E4H0_9BASI|nr:hypothetical protein [Austropuccinia psidii MF-1]